MSCNVQTTGLSLAILKRVFILKKTLASVRIKISKLSEPAKAKSAGNKVDLRPDWESVKYQVMLDINRLKFEDPNLEAKLLNTGEAYLEETNWWGDVYWGVCNGIGENNLGEILMLVRGEKQEAR